MRLVGKMPAKVYLACSGGIDSMFVLDFLLKGKREVTLLYFNHNTEHGKEALDFLKNISDKLNLTLISEEYLGTDSTEVSWRNARYSFFSKYTDMPIITAHHLDDNIETYIMSEVKGTAKFIPYKRGNIIRPFLLFSKKSILEYVRRYNVSWIEDDSNSKCDYDRNKIRNKVIPILREINPGLDKTYFKKCFNKYQKDGFI